MKIIGFILLSLLVLIGFSLGLDILLGYDLENSVKHAFNPFHVRETAEIVLFGILIFFLAGIKPFLQKRKKSKR